MREVNKIAAAQGLPAVELGTGSLSGFAHVLAPQAGLILN
jgi:hypothetical protein